MADIPLIPPPIDINPTTTTSPLQDAYLKNFGKSMITGEGDEINIPYSNSILYTIFPFGQLFLRFYELGGSLDKPYLLIFLIPSITLIYYLLNPLDEGYAFKSFISYVLVIVGNVVPVLLANYGKLQFINHREPQRRSHTDFYIILPIIFRFILAAALSYIKLPFSKVITYFVSFLFVLLANGLHISTRKECNSNNKRGNDLNRFLKVLVDSAGQFGFAFILPLLFVKSATVKNAAYFQQLSIFGSLKELTEGGLWSCGLFVAYIFNHMLDDNFAALEMNGYYPNSSKYVPDEICTGQIDKLRIFIALTLFFVVIGAYSVNSLETSINYSVDSSTM